MTQFPIDVSCKLNAVQVDGYVRYLGQAGYQRGNCSFGYDARSCQLLEELFELLRQVEPNGENGCKELWLCARRGTLEEFAESYGTYQENLDEGNVETYDEYLAYWRAEFPDELMWYYFVALDDPTIQYRAVFLNQKQVVELDGRRENGCPHDISPFAQWLVDAVRRTICAIRAGTYFPTVDRLLPYRHRVGTITRERLWQLYPQEKAAFFAPLSQEELGEFLASDPEHLDAKAALLPTMTANDFYGFCSLGYEVNGYDCQGLTPKEQYSRFADGRDEGLKELPPDDPEAFADWMEHRERGGHPWEVFRGGNSTHISLYVRREPESGYSLELWGSATGRCMEAVKFYLALKHAGVPVRLRDGRLLQKRLQGKEKIGIVPQGVLPVYCESYLPGEEIIDFMNLSYEDPQREIDLAEWQPLKPVRLVGQ